MYPLCLYIYILFGTLQSAFFSVQHHAYSVDCTLYIVRGVVCVQCTVYTLKLKAERLLATKILAQDLSITRILSETF